MALKIHLLCVIAVGLSVAHASPLFAPAHAGYYGHPGSIAVASPAITTQQANTLRSFGNLGQVTSFSKTIDTPFSSVSKSDVRVSNPGLSYGVGYAPALAGHAGYAPALAPGYVRPAVAAVPHAAAAGLLGVAFSAAPAVSHMTYSAPALGLSYAW